MGIWGLGQRMAAWGARLVSEASASLRAIAGFFGVGGLAPQGPAVELPRAPASNILKERAYDLGGGVKLDLVLVPAGAFPMGSPKGSSNERPLHEVKLSRPFYMGKYPVTQEQWQAVMGSNPSRFKGPKNPVEGVGWYAGQEFLRKLGERTGGKFGLPSEAEWEYACRAGGTGEFCFGDDEWWLGEYAWFLRNAGGKTHPVGQKKPNARGLYDLHGNVWEWCEDAYHDGYADAPTDGSPCLRGGVQGVRVVRGGAWCSTPGDCRSGTRNWTHPGSNWDSQGLRVVLRGF